MAAMLEAYRKGLEMADIFWSYRSQKGHKKRKGVTAQNRNPLNLLVGGTGFEPVTSTV